MTDWTLFRLCCATAGDVLEVLEYRHDFASFNFTIDLFKYVFLTFAPEVIMHSQSQDEEQVRGHYDRGSYNVLSLPRMSPSSARAFFRPHAF